MRIPTLPPPNPLTVVCIWIAAIFIALREAAQKAQIFPGLVQAMSGVWSFLPLGVLVLSAAVYLVNWLRPHHGRATRAALELRTSGTALPATLLSQTNVWRWYLLTIIGNFKDRANVPIQQTLFISFDRPMGVNTAEITSPDINLPLHEVKEFTAKYAIIAFVEPIPAGRLVVTMKL
jgi:hypothetical protein